MVAGGAVLAQVLRQGTTLRSPKSCELYGLERHLGEGAHGQVWLARSSTGSSHAVKVVVPAAHSAEQAALLASEISKAQAASDFVRELVPQFHEAFSIECPNPLSGCPVGLLVIVMEYIDGYSLDTVVARFPLPEGHAAIILRSLCLALQRLHERGTIHRDVKGANVMIASNGRVYLCDFGVSRCLERTTDRVQTVAGTPYWMAPEVVLGAHAWGAAGYGIGADVWSLGITAIELVDGAPPLARNALCKANAYHVFHVVARDAPPRLDAASHSPLLRRFVARCLVKDPARRASLQELLQDPNGFLQPFPNNQQLIQDLVAHLRFGDGAAASAGASASAGLAAANADSAASAASAASATLEPGQATLTFEELQHGLAIASKSSFGSSGFGSFAADELPADECTVNPLLRLPLPDVASVAPGGPLAAAAAPPRLAGHFQGATSKLPQRPCPSSPPPTPLATLLETTPRSPAAQKILDAAVSPASPWRGVGALATRRTQS